ncbi:hypothetical protein EX30DRAFT_339391 [Ascodesmis nigricans]|uniref:Centromere protein H C-terminal domain-containing protein n=1 Tax=Ascodesmis nigricans TaxID=341454 RepID=A0A4S2N2B9_9PEZI|nr:hypothetical protein EX30DRAFT_339391 [Ascodesmis nigricans]
MTSLEPNPSPLAALRTASLTLLFSSQSHPVGFPALHLTPTTSLASHLSEKEIHLLELYDKLQELSFQRHLLEASVSAPKGGEYIESDEELQRKLDEARGNRKLKEAVTESMLIAKPILRAVHPVPLTAEGVEDVLAKRERLVLSLFLFSW